MKVYKHVFIYLCFKAVDKCKVMYDLHVDFRIC